ncbi:MAG: helix-turn-helix domain-containing protein [Lachnospiraceae bacterium]|nr:helix-turn-helix domain-containing protein [Lachnospiraceae bacterium]
MLELGQEKAYNVQETAEILKISAVTVRAYIKTGRLKAQTIGRPLYVTEKELKRFLRGEESNE